jgi:hypothetical protein
MPNKTKFAESARKKMEAKGKIGDFKRISKTPPSFVKNSKSFKSTYK